MKGEPSPFWIPLVFPFLWLGMCNLLSRLAGWHRLAERYAATLPPVGRRFWIESGKFGWVSYNSCLTIHATPEGLHLAVWLPFRFGHPPLLIPWRELRNVGSRTVWLCGEWLKLEVGSPSIATLELSKKVFTPQPAAA